MGGGIFLRLFNSYLFLGMAWDAALKQSGIELELLDNEPMYSFFEKSIRGGICQISLRHAKANTPEMEDFDPSKPRVDLMYVDANNLYGKGNIFILS